MANLFTGAQKESEQLKPSDWLASYGRYLDDVRAALDWSMQPGGAAELGISLTASALTLWTHLSLLNELQHRTELALDRLGPDAANGAAREMKLFAALSYAMVNLYGPTPRGTKACQAALEIARKIGDHSNQAKALLALWNGCFANGEVRLSLKLAEQFMSVASELGPADVLVGHRMMGSSHFYLGDVAEGRRHMEIMVAGYGATAHDSHMARFGFSQLASGYGLLGYHLCFQGYFDRAMTATRRSVEVALSSDHALSACGVLGTTSIANSIYTGHLMEARRYVEILYETARSHGLQRWENFACGFDGIICVREGQPDAGLRKLSVCVSQAHDRADTRYMFIFSEYALALGRAGHQQAGLTEIDAILERLGGTGERWYLPELHRCRAELLRMLGRDPAEVEAAFRQALSLATELGGLNWRLLAASDFADFLRSRGRQQEGFDILSGAYDRFTEGYDGPKLHKIREQLLASPA